MISSIKGETKKIIILVGKLGHNKSALVKIINYQTIY